LFPGEGPDSCLDRECYAAKTDAHIARTLQQNPDLIQISSSWGARNGGPLGRNRYIEVTPAKNGSGKATPMHKRCPHLGQGDHRRGRLARPNPDHLCGTELQGSPRPNELPRQAEEKARVERQKQNEKRKVELTTRYRVLAAVLAKVSAALSKADLVLIATASLSRLPYEYTHSLTLRHKLTLSDAG